MWPSRSGASSPQSPDQRRPNEFEVAREAFDEAKEVGATDEEAFRAAADAVGQTATFEQAIAEGRSDDEALRIARDEAREEENRFFQPDQERVQAAREELGRVFSSDIDLEKAGTEIGKQIVEKAGGGIEGVQAAQEAVFNVLDESFRSEQSSFYLGNIIISVGRSQEDQLFGEALLRGASVDEAFQELDRSFRGNRSDEEIDFRMFDFVENNAFTQGFDPFLQVASVIEDTFAELRAEAELEEGTITIFDETVVGTTKDETLVGSAGDTKFVFNQGSTLGGTDTFVDAGGQDQRTLGNLNDILFVYDAVIPSLTYSNSSQSVTGQATLNSSIEQLFVADTSGTTQLITFPTGESGTGILLVGTEGDDNLVFEGDGTSAIDFQKGAISINLVNTSIFRAIILGGDGDDILTGPGGSVFRGGPGNDTLKVTGPNASLFGDSGDDTFIFPRPSLLNDISVTGGANSSSGGDTLQLGDSSTASGLTFQFSNIGLSGIEILNVFPSNTTVIGSSIGYFSLSKITTATGAGNITLTSTDSNLNLTNTTISSGVTTLTATQVFNSGVNISTVLTVLDEH